jgi:hypothetical protein
MGTIVFLIIAITILILIRVAAGGFDSDRIKEEIEAKGGKLISQTWTPFGKGWFGSHDRIYQVDYSDKDGNTHRAFVKTSMFSGVYFTDDQIVEYCNEHSALPDKNRSALQEENERLKKELLELKQTIPNK